MSSSGPLRDFISYAHQDGASLSPGSYSSEICRADQLRALDKGNRVIPVLAVKLADRPLLPVYSAVFDPLPRMPTFLSNAIGRDNVQADWNWNVKTSIGIRARGYDAAQ